MKKELKVTLLSITPHPAELLEQVAMISYRTQRFDERVSEAKVVFKSGRVLKLSELGLKEAPKPGDVIRGFTKDDKYVAEIIEPSCDNVVRWLRKLGHHSLFEIPSATFLVEGLSRKSCLHYLRYRFLTTNFESQKYHPQNSFNWVLPDKGEEPEEVIEEIQKCYEEIQNMYERLRNMGADPEWARIVLPNGAAQRLVLHTNFRQWRHILQCLVPEDYVNENRKLAVKVLEVLKKEAPVFFEDFVELEDGKWKVPSSTRNLCVNFCLATNEKRKLNIPVPEFDTKNIE